MDESQLTVRDAGCRIELEYSLARYPRALEALTGRRVSPFGDVYVDERERFGYAYRSRVEGERLLKVTCRTLEPNLVEAVKGYMKFERDTLTQVVEARAKAAQALVRAHHFNLVRRFELSMLPNHSRAAAAVPEVTEVERSAGEAFVTTYDIT